SVQRAVDLSILKSFPYETQKWALSNSRWSDEIASLAAVTFPASRDGLLAMLEAHVSVENLPSLVTQYLIPLAHGRFPAWTRRIAVEDERLIATLLTASLTSN